MNKVILKMKTKIISLFYCWILKPILFCLDPEKVHDRFIVFGKILGRRRFTRNITSRLFLYKDQILEQHISGIYFKNPIGLAAGFDKNAELTDIFPDVGFGFVEVGSITGEPCEGNAKPRLWRIPEKKSLRVNYGLKSDGAEVISMRMRGKRYLIPIGVSIAKTNSQETIDMRQGIADYIKVATLFRDIGDYITINISCPNAYGGEPFLDPYSLEELLKAYYMLRITKPTFLKLAAGMKLSCIDDILEVGDRYGIDGYICTNLKKNNGETGGLSGKAVEMDSDNMIKYVYERCGKKRIIIGCGGVFSAVDAYRKIKNGASLVQLITGMIFQGPQLIGNINMDLARLLKEDGFSNISEAIGVSSEV